MSRKRFTEEFEIEAVRQITERGFAAKAVAERLRVSPNSLVIKYFENKCRSWLGSRIDEAVRLSTNHHRLRTEATFLQQDHAKPCGLPTSHQRPVARPSV
jgi:transposase